MEKRLAHLSFIEIGEEETSLLVGALSAMLIAALGGIANWLRRTRKKDRGTFIAAVVSVAFEGSCLTFS